MQTQTQDKETMKNSILYNVKLTWLKTIKGQNLLKYFEFLQNAQSNTGK